MTNHGIQDIRGLTLRLSDGDPQLLPDDEGIRNLQGMSGHLHASAASLNHFAQLATAVVDGPRVFRKHQSGKLPPVAYVIHHFPPSTSLAMVFNCMFDVPS